MKGAYDDITRDSIYQKGVRYSKKEQPMGGDGRKAALSLDFEKSGQMQRLRIETSMGKD